MVPGNRTIRTKDTLHSGVLGAIIPTINAENGDNMQNPGEATPSSLQPIWWEIIAGGILILAGIVSLFALDGPAFGQLMGVPIFVLGVWFAYAGTRPLRHGSSGPPGGPVFFGNPLAIRKRVRTGRDNSPN